MKRIDEILELIHSDDIDEKIKGIVFSGNIKCLSVFLDLYYISGRLFSVEHAIIAARHSDQELMPYLDVLVRLSDEADFYSPSSAIIASRVWRMEKTEKLKAAMEKLAQQYRCDGDRDACRAVEHFITEKKFPSFDPDDEPSEMQEEFSQKMDGMDDPCDIDIAIGMLNSRNPESVQQQGRALAESIASRYCFCDVLFHPEQEGSRLNLAEILCKCSDQELAYGELLLPWIEDAEKDYSRVCFDRLVQVAPCDELDEDILDFSDDSSDRKRLSSAQERLRSIRKNRQGS